MPARKKIILLIGLFGLTILASLIIFSACDQRKPFNPKISVSHNITMSLYPLELNVFSTDDIDTVLINIWVRDDFGLGLDSIEVDVSRTPELGSIVPPSLTLNGNTHALFVINSGMYFDSTNFDTTVTFSVISNTDTAYSTLNVLYPEQAMNMSFDPAKLFVYSSVVPDTVKINVWIRNKYGDGIDDVDVMLSRNVEIGTITQPNPTVNGYASGLFVMDPGYNSDTTITFTAQSANILYSYTRSLDVSYSSQTVSMSFRPSPLYIHSINKPDTVEIDIWVLNDDGVGIDSLEVGITRAPEIGSIVPPERTVNGYTKGLFITEPGYDTYSELRFTANTDVAIDTATLVIVPSVRGEIGSMNISLQKSRLIADGEDKTKIFVAVIDTTGVPIGDGTAVRIIHYGASTPGVLDPATGIDTTSNGIAEFELTAPSSLDPDLIIEHDSLKAWAISISGDTSFAYNMVTYEPGEPNSIEFISYPDTMIAGTGETDSVWVKIFDENNNYIVDGTQVRFRNSDSMTTSTVTPVTVTSGGKAYGIYVVGTESGHDWVQAYIKKPQTTDTLWSDQAEIVIKSNEPTNIDLSVTDPDFEVGGSSTIIIATLQDANGNALSDGFGVRFEITQFLPCQDLMGPGAPSFDSAAVDTVPVISSVETETNVNGQAFVNLFSGILAGPVSIKSTSLDYGNIYKEKALITIQSGPPAHVEIGPSNIAVPEGEALKTGVTASVWDQFTNPVECSTAVYFSLIPDDVAFIYGFAVTTGYLDENGDTVGIKGVAYTWMVYTSSETFDTVRVVASSGDIADTSGPVVLALYEGQIDIWSNPGVIYVDPPPDYGDAEVTVQLLDGLGNTISNGIIIFTTQVCGNLVGQVIDTTDIQGFAYTTFRIYGDQIPDNSPPAPPSCTAKVKAKLAGYPVVEGETDIYCQLIQ